MAALSNARIADLLDPFYPEPTNLLLAQLSTYLDLLLKWNARTNLTAIRDPEQIVFRHFGESLFTATRLPPCTTLLDLGSGAGFPGIPIQLALPALNVTLAESQNKKAAFLREVVRTLSLPTQVWAGRAEELLSEQVFDVVALRAVDEPDSALALARRLTVPGGTVAHLAVSSDEGEVGISIPGSQRSVLRLLTVSP